MLFINEFTKATWIMLLKEKSKAFKHLKKFKAQVENEKYLKIKVLRSNRGREYISRQFEELCEEHGIKRQYYVARTPQKNGVVERKNIKI